MAVYRIARFEVDMLRTMSALAMLVRAGTTPRGVPPCLSPVFADTGLWNSTRGIWYGMRQRTENSAHLFGALGSTVYRVHLQKHRS